MCLFSQPHRGNVDIRRHVPRIRGFVEARTDKIVFHVFHGKLGGKTIMRPRNSGEIVALFAENILDEEIVLCASAPNFRSNSTRGSGTVETAKPQACEGQNISSVCHMHARQKLKNSDSFVILFHGPQENIWFQLEDIDFGGFLDEVVLFFCSRSRLTLWSDAAGSLEIPMLCILPIIRTRVGQRVDWHVFCDRTCGIRPNCGCTEIVSLDAASWHWVVPRPL